MALSAAMANHECRRLSGAILRTKTPDRSAKAGYILSNSILGIRLPENRAPDRLLSLLRLWGFVALWYMGQMATDADRQLVVSMTKAVDLVLGTDAYAELERIHPERHALAQFFGVSSTPQ